MSRPIARTFGAHTLAATVATSSTAALAAAPTARPAFFLTGKTVTFALHRGGSSAPIG
jgi:hypothetical protein